MPNFLPLPKFEFNCPRCGKSTEYELKSSISECDTPIGTVQTGCYEAYCRACGKQLKSRDLKNFNYMLMIMATMAFWRIQHPEGTKKQCRRVLMLDRHTVERFWDICMSELGLDAE